MQQIHQQSMLLADCALDELVQGKAHLLEVCLEFDGEWSYVLRRFLVFTFARSAHCPLFLGIDDDHPSFAPSLLSLPWPFLDR